jgi:ABC-type multidrug transport system fused ATPase/permease subunit
VIHAVPSRSLYARTKEAVLRGKKDALAIVVGSLMHASGHAFLAAAGGSLARSLAGGGASMDHLLPPAALLALGRGDAMLGLALAGLFAAIAKLVGGTIAARSEAKVAGEVGARLRIEVLDDVLAVHALRAPRHGDHGSAQSASRVASLTTHVADAERGVSHGVLAELRAMVQLVPLGVLLVVLAPKLALSATVAMAAFGVFAFTVRRAFKRAPVRAAEDAGRLSAAADEAVRHAELWATYGAEKKIRTHVESLGARITREAASLRARAALLSGTSEVLGALALVLALALVAAGAVTGIDRGGLVPFAVVFFMAYRPLREFVDARIVRARGEAACAAATRGEPAPASDGERAPTAWPNGALVLDGVVAEHAAHAPISLTVPHGRVVAVVGPTGVGKTQLLRALLGLAPLARGRVHYASKSLANAGVGPAERPFARVPQDAPILADTLEANVALGGKSGAVDPTLAKSIGDAVLVTERKLSGGERQLVAVARALATELPVLLLDEPTASLDPESERALLAELVALKGERTVVIVTHRPAPLGIADVVVRLTHVDETQHRSGLDLDDVAAE